MLELLLGLGFRKAMLNRYTEKMELNRLRKVGSKAECWAWELISFAHNYRWGGKRRGNGVRSVNDGGGNGHKGIGRKGDC